MTSTCTITNNDQPGTIIVKKIIKPTGSLTSFAFNTTGTGYSGFSLAGGQQNSQTLNAGSYTVKELVPLGWVLTGIGGSSDVNTPYNCTVTGSGGSTGAGDSEYADGHDLPEERRHGHVRVREHRATAPLGPRASGPRTRSSRYIAWFGGTAFGHTFPGVATTAGIGDTMICGRDVDTLAKVMGGFWSSISKKTTGAKKVQHRSVQDAAPPAAARSGAERLSVRERPRQRLVRRVGDPHCAERTTRRSTPLRSKRRRSTPRVTPVPSLQGRRPTARAPARLRTRCSGTVIKP